MTTTGASVYRWWTTICVALPLLLLLASQTTAVDMWW